MSAISDKIKNALDDKEWFRIDQYDREKMIRRLCDMCDSCEDAADRYGMNLLLKVPDDQYPDLKPCPFCGAPAEIKKRMPELSKCENVKGATIYKIQIHVGIQCSKCGMTNAFGGRTAAIALDGDTMTPITSLYRDPNLLRLVDHWNRRTDNG